MKSINNGAQVAMRAHSASLTTPTSASPLPQASPTAEPRADGFDRASTTATRDSAIGAAVVAQQELPAGVALAIDYVEQQNASVDAVIAEQSQSGSGTFFNQSSVSRALLLASRRFELVDKQTPHPALTTAFHALVMKVADDCFRRLEMNFDHRQNGDLPKSSHAYDADSARNFWAAFRGGKSEFSPLNRLWRQVAASDSPEGATARRQLRGAIQMAVQIEEGAWQDAGVVSSTLRLEERIVLMNFDRFSLNANGVGTLLDAAKKAQADGDAAFAERLLREVQSALPRTPRPSRDPSKHEADIAAFNSANAATGLGFDDVERLQEEIRALRSLGQDRATIQRIDLICAGLPLDPQRTDTDLGYVETRIARSSTASPSVKAHAAAARSRVDAYRRQRFIDKANLAIDKMGDSGLLSLSSSEYDDLTSGWWGLSEFVDESDNDDEVAAFRVKIKAAILDSLPKSRKVASRQLADARQAPVDVASYRTQLVDYWNDLHRLNEAEEFLEIYDDKIGQGRYADHVTLLVEQIARLLQQSPDDDKVAKLAKDVRSRVEYGFARDVLPKRHADIGRRYAEVVASISK